MANWGSLWACNMAAEKFGKDAYTLWQRIWAERLPQGFSGFIWRWMQVAIEICWNPLDSAT